MDLSIYFLIPSSNCMVSLIFGGECMLVVLLVISMSQSRHQNRRIDRQVYNGCDLCSLYEYWSSLRHTLTTRLPNNYHIQLVYPCLKQNRREQVYHQIVQELSHIPVVPCWTNQQISHILVSRCCKQNPNENFKNQINQQLSHIP